jgi:hypothetical protein
MTLGVVRSIDRPPPREERPTAARDPELAEAYGTAPLSTA